MSTTKPNSIRKFLTQTATEVAQALDGIVFPGSVVSDDISAGWVAVEVGFILRIYVSVDSYIAFNEFDAGAGVTVDATTSPAAFLKSGSIYHVITTDQWVRASVNPDRIEKISL